MAMWFSHLRFVEASAVRLNPPLDRLASCWGSLCCDVDKVFAVPREVSHYGREGLNFSPEEFLERAQVGRDDAVSQASFLAGYLSHMAVDEAWYAHLFRIRSAPGGLGDAWTYETTRALNLALDRRNRSLYDPAGLDFSQASGEDVLPHLRGPARDRMVHAATIYVRWSGLMDWRPDDALLGPVTDRFRALMQAEQARVDSILEALDAEALDREVVAFTTDVLQRFLDDLASRQD